MKARPLKVSPSPFVFSGLRLEAASLVILATLLIQIILMIAFKDIRALIVILATLIGACAAEVCFASPVLGIGGTTGKCKKFSDGVAAISGLLAGFLLPSSVNPFLAAITSFLGLFISRNFFNGKGNAWISAPALSVIFVFLSAPSHFGALGAFPPAGFDNQVAAFLNRAFLGRLGISLPEGYVSLFFNPAHPVPALKFGIVTLTSSIALFALDTIDWIAPAASLVVYALCVFLFSAGGNVLFALFSGGIFFVAVYILSDFSTLPRARTGRAALGVFAGVMTFFVCGQGGGSTHAAVFVVFAANLASLVIEYAEERILRLHSQGGSE